MAGPLTPPVWEESHVSDTHTQLDCSQSFIIAFSRVSGRYICKTFFRRKSTQILASLDIIFLKFLGVLVSIINKTISRVLRTQSCTYCTDKQWFINNVYIEIWEVCFKTQIYILKIGSLASLARNFCIHFLQFPTRRHSIRPYYHEHKWTY